MHLGIDVREACRPVRAGKAQWTYGVVSELLTRGIPVTLFSDAPVPESWVHHAHVTVRILPAGLTWHWRVASLLKSRKTPVTQYVSPTSYLVPFLLGRNFPHNPVVHDLIAFRGEPHDSKATLLERITLRRAMRTASHIFTVSRSTTHDLCVQIPDLQAKKITPVFAGPMREHPLARRPDGKTILCIATLCPRKNQANLVRAYAALPVELRAKHTLVLCGGRGWHDDDILDLVKDTDGASWRGQVDDKTYQELLATCEVFALPSRYEGFGMQILDALQSAVPVLTSARGSLQEVAGDAALMVDPEDVSSITRGLEKLLNDPALRTSLATKGPVQAAQFSWKRTADLVLEGLSRV